MATNAWLRPNLKKHYREVSIAKEGGTGKRKESIIAVEGVLSAHRQIVREMLRKHPLQGLLMLVALYFDDK
jgi:hypothetical protein